MNLSPADADCSQFSINFLRQHQTKSKLSCKAHVRNPHHCFTMGNYTGLVASRFNCAFFSTNSFRLCFELCVNAAKSPEPSATQRRSTLCRPRIIPQRFGRNGPTCVINHPTHSHILGKLVPEARLELARLASEVFETSASTIPPLGPAKQGLSGPAGGVNGL